MHDFAAAGCSVIGLSFDTVSDNKAWAENQGFEFRLLSDEDHRVGRLYEVEREPDDQYAAFPLRVSYLVDPEGVDPQNFRRKRRRGPRRLRAQCTLGAEDVMTDQSMLGDPVPGRARLIRPLRVTTGRGAPDSASDAAELSQRIAAVAKGGARAAVLGVNDGLVTNVCLILAVAGASASAADVRLAGFASLVAGALSMAAGEWVSVRSQVELYMGLLAEVRRLVDRNPKFILDQLSERLEDAGFGRATAQTAAAELPLDEGRFLDFTARTMFGINPSELGSPSQRQPDVADLLRWRCTRAADAMVFHWRRHRYLVIDKPDRPRGSRRWRKGRSPK
jgi:hypothetical protein